MEQPSAIDGLSEPVQGERLSGTMEGEIPPQRGDAMSLEIKINKED